MLFVCLFAATAVLGGVAADCSSGSGADVADVVVWGGTVCGVTAAVAAHRSDPTLSIVWVVNGTRLGGMTSGGLGGVDRAMNIGGLAAELLLPLGRGFEPHVAEAAMYALLGTAGDAVTLRKHSGWISNVETSGIAPRSITGITTLDGHTQCGRVFIDCSYEGDLARLSGTAYAVGREATHEYNESMAGTDGGLFNHTDLTEKLSWFNATVSPWTDSSNTTLLPTITAVAPPINTPGGAADDKVMAMCFRMCLTNNASNAIEITAPPGYTTASLELLRREIVAATGAGMTLGIKSMFLVRQLSNAKIDLNSGQWSALPGSGGFFPFSTDLPFAQYGWPTAGPAARAAIFEEHKWWTQALLYYLANDVELAKIQPTLVAEMKSYGRCADEYGEMPDRWTPQLYVRESIRLRGAKVITQADVCNPEPSPTGVGVSEWGVDVHAVQRLAAVDPNTGNWRVYNAGGRDAGRDHIASCKGGLVEVPYEAMIPKVDDTTNLYVPVCPSFTHIAFATYRLESQYAIFGHACGTAAALALKDSKEAPTVQNVNVTDLRMMLLKQHQLLSSNSTHPPSPSPSPANSKTWTCAAPLKRCVGVAGGSGGHSTFANNTCSGECTPLAPHEWLAHDCCGLWSHKGSTLVALKGTYLKKSTVGSALLPDDEKQFVKEGFVCTRVPAATTYDQYVLCETK